MTRILNPVRRSKRVAILRQGAVPKPAAPRCHEWRAAAAWGEALPDRVFDAKLARSEAVRERRHDEHQANLQCVETLDRCGFTPEPSSGSLMLATTDNDSAQPSDASSDLSGDDPVETLFQILGVPDPVTPTSAEAAALVHAIETGPGPKTPPNALRFEASTPATPTVLPHVSVASISPMKLPVGFPRLQDVLPVRRSLGVCDVGLPRFL